MKKNFYKILSFILICISITFFSACSFLESSSDSDTTYIYHNLNETFTFDQIEYTFKNVKIKKYYAEPFTGYGHVYYPSNDQNYFIAIEFELFNPTSSTLYLEEDEWLTTIRKYTFKLIYNNEVDYYSSYFDASYFYQSQSKINPLEKLESVILFSVPETVALSENNLELRLSYNKTNATEFHCIVLRGSIGQYE